MVVTLKTVAKRSGLSVSTVSGVLGARSHLFSPATRRRVQRAAKALGYRPSGCARSMRNRQYGRIAILVANHGHLHQDLMNGIEAVLAERDWHAVSVWTPDPPAARPPRVLREHLADGLIVAWDVPAGTAALADSHVEPAVWVNTQRPWDSAYCDDAGGTRLATERLLRLGHRRIAYADYVASSHYSSLGRRDGYVQAMRAAGLTPDVHRVTVKPQAARIALARAWLAAADRPTAVLTYCPATAFPLLFAATSLSLRVPGELSLVTVDAELQDDVGIEIATLVEPNREVGQAATQMLLDKIAHPGRRCRSRTFVPVLQEGQTLAPPESARPEAHRLMGLERQA